MGSLILGTTPRNPLLSTERSELFYYIAVRTYDRSLPFVSQTYALLNQQKGIDLYKQLFIFVSDEEQYKLYEDALGYLPYRSIIVGKLGLKQQTDFILDFFADGQNVFFLDDDMLGFYEYPGPPLKSKINKTSVNMGKFLSDGFETIRQEGLSTFCFRNMVNAVFIGGAPYKQIRPFFVYGGAWGGVTDKELFSTSHSHVEDAERTAKVMEKDGGTLLYNWAGFLTHSLSIGYGINSGGMQTSGDRGTLGHREEFTRRVAEEVYKLPAAAKFLTPPFFNSKTGAFDFKLKRITSLRKYGIKEKSYD